MHTCSDKGCKLICKHYQPMMVEILMQFQIEPCFYVTLWQAKVGGIINKIPNSYLHPHYYPHCILSPNCIHNAALHHNHNNAVHCTTPQYTHSTAAHHTVPHYTALHPPHHITLHIIPISKSYIFNIT